MRVAESYLDTERLRQAGQQCEELGLLRRQALFEVPTRVSSSFVGGTLGSLVPDTVPSELPAVAGSSALQGDIARRLTHQDITSMAGAAREMVSRIMRDREVGGYLETRREEVRRPPQEEPRRSPLTGFYERRLSELRERLNTLETIRITNAAATNRALLGTIVDEDWLGARLLGVLAESRTASKLAALLKENVDQVAVALARLHRGGAVDVNNGHFLRNERGAEMMTRLQEATGVDLAAP